MKKKRIYVLDTNIPLYDWKCCSSFEEHDVCIPIEVVSEVDHFKKGMETINYNARSFTKFLDELPAEKIFDGGAPLGVGLGKIRVIMGFPYHNNVDKYFPERTVDHMILNTVYCISKSDEHKNSEIFLVTKDVNLRIKAKSLGLKAEDYRTDAVTNVEILYKGVKVIQVADKEIEILYSKGTIAFNNSEVGFVENEYTIVNSVDTSKTSLAVYKKNNLHIIVKDKVSPFGIKPKNSEQAFALNALLDPNITLVSINGKAGVGKTIISLSAAMDQLESKIFDQVFFTRQTIALGNKEVGFLPGDVNQKLSPFMQALHDNLSVIKNIPKNAAKITRFLEEDKIVIEPLPFLRGRSLVRKFFIIDEAQNLTPQEVKAIVTRAGEGTKIVLIGDITQIDHPLLDERSNGLSYLIEKMRGQEFYTHIVLKKGERSALAEAAGNLL